jgi:hypothetical protein
MSQLKRMDVGFQGGQVLSLRAAPEAHEALARALTDDAGARWHELQAEESEYRIDLSQVVYVRRETEGHSVGF